MLVSRCCLSKGDARLSPTYTPKLADCIHRFARAFGDMGGGGKGGGAVKRDKLGRPLNFGTFKNGRDTASGKGGGKGGGKKGGGKGGGGKGGGK
eukprot:scaffold24863_cov62-Phaeocystis_antarctica.AAC.6